MNQSADEIRAAIAHLDRCIARRKKNINQLKPGKYVERSTLPKEFLRLLDSGQLSQLRQNLSVRSNVLGSTLLSISQRPYEYATRDRSPEVKDNARRLLKLQERRQNYLNELEALLERLQSS